MTAPEPNENNPHRRKIVRNENGEDRKLGWETIGPSGRFWWIHLPLSQEANHLNDGSRSIFHGEFDTEYEKAAWESYRRDPLRVLLAEGIPMPAANQNQHVGILMLKFEEGGGRGKLFNKDGTAVYDPSETEEQYREMMEKRGKLSENLLVDTYGGVDTWTEIPEEETTRRDLVPVSDGVTIETQRLNRRVLYALRKRVHVSTLVLNHEIALNPRIGMT